MTSVRKALFWVLLLLAAALCGSALAATETEYSLAPCPGTIMVADTYTVLTPSNLDQNLEFLNNIDKNKDTLLTDWEERGVVLQAWTARRDACLEVRVQQDEYSRLYYDLVNHPADGLKAFLEAHKKNAAYTEQGYTFQDLETKQFKNKNYTIRMQYKRVNESGTIRGHMVKTVARGYTVTLDYQVYNRLPKEGDKTAVAKVANTFMFFDAEPAAGGTQEGSAEGIISGSAVPVPLQITAEPPEKTNTDTFTVEGRTAPGAHLIGVLMPMINNSEAVRFYADANEKNGNFKMKVTLPEEGTWLMTLNVEDLTNSDLIAAEKVFDITIYKKTLIPVTLDAEPAEILTSDELVISGTTMKGTKVQCIVQNGTDTFDKTVTPNGTGRFTFKVKTERDATYDIVLVFSKRNYETERLTFSSTRSLSAEEQRARIRKESVHPGYSTLLHNITTYIGKTMNYNVHIVDIREEGNEWIITGAAAKSVENYRNFMVFVTEQEPNFAVGDQVMIYGICRGSYQIQSEEGNDSYPQFDILFYD